jgi:hypothetical protein
MKPKACKLWPFKIYKTPKHGQASNAEFIHGDDVFFVYVDPLCLGIRWGTPTLKFSKKILPEFVDIALELNEKQSFSTSNITYYPIKLRFK